MDPHSNACRLTRRELLARGSTGFGMVALAGLLAEDQAASARAATSDPSTKPAPWRLSPEIVRKPAKHVIFCYMSGGVSHLDSFDPKPRLDQDAGKPMPMPVHRTMFNNNGNI